MSVEKEWLTIAEFADALEVSQQTVRRAITDGRLVAHRPLGARRILINRKELQSAYLRTSRRADLYGFPVEKVRHQGRAQCEAFNGALNTNRERCEREGQFYKVFNSPHAGGFRCLLHIEEMEAAFADAAHHILNSDEGNRMVCEKSKQVMKLGIEELWVA